MPPKPAEAAKVQPKKETVRINLPPKPTSAPTIKLPTLAPSRPGQLRPGPPRPAAPRPAAPPPPAAPSASARCSAAPAAATRQRPRPRRLSVRLLMSAPSAGVGMMDKVLAIAAVVVVLAAVGSSLYLVLGGIPGLTSN